MEIPIGRDYIFTVKVLEPDSFIALDVTGYTGIMNIYKRADDVNITTLNLTPVVGDELNGYMTGTVLGTETSSVVPLKGMAADDYYIKDEYAGFIEITKPGEPNINVVIEDISLIPTGA